MDEKPGVSLDPDRQPDPPPQPESVPERSAERWARGDEPITKAQAAYLKRLARLAGEDVPEGLSKTEAGEQIERLRRELDG